MPWGFGATRPFVSVVAVSVGIAASIGAQQPSPRPHPTPAAATPKAGSDARSLMPVDTVWALALNNLLTKPPAYDGAQAFFAIEGDRIAAYDLMTGRQQWIVTARPATQPVAGGRLLFIVESNTLRALHAADGSTAWELPFADRLAVHPVWDNGWLVLATAAGEVRAYRATDGELIWRRDLKSPAHAAPALATDRVYIPATDGRIVALRVESGEPIWERRLGGAVNEILALDERLYAGSQDNFFYCVMTSDGRIDWRWRTGADVIGKPIADDRYVYFVSLDNVLRAMNMVTGGQQWMRPLPIRPAWGPVKAGTTIVVTGQAPPLRLFNAKDGVVAGTLTGVATQPVEAETAPAPAAADGAARPKKPWSFGALVDPEVAAAPYVIEHPLTRAPLLLMLFKEIAKGASATFVIHSFEPPIVTAIAPLPNLIQIAPVAPTTPPPRH